VIIPARDVAVSSTAEVILHSGYPLQIVRNKHGLRWEVVKHQGGARYKYTTHIVGTVMGNDITTHTFEVYGGPYAGAGLGYDLLSRGDNETAAATIPWNYVKNMWILEQKEIPDTSLKTGRLNVVKSLVRF
jgi:hypothetical protein